MSGLARAAVSGLLAAGLLLAGCGDAADSGSGEQAETVIAVSMDEFRFDPQDITLPAGAAVRIALTNDGSVPHEFMVGREPMEQDGDLHGYEVDFFDGIHPTVTGSEADADHGHHDGFMLTLAPGETAEVAFTVPEDREGDWEVGCFEPGHYEGGMHGTLTVR